MYESESVKLPASLLSLIKTKRVRRSRSTHSLCFRAPKGSYVELFSFKIDIRLANIFYLEGLKMLLEYLFETYRKLNFMLFVLLRSIPDVGCPIGLIHPDQLRVYKHSVLS